METKEQDNQWHLVRNDNGEWISEENVVFLTNEKHVLCKLKQG